MRRDRPIFGPPPSRWRSALSLAAVLLAVIVLILIGIVVLAAMVS